MFLFVFKHAQVALADGLRRELKKFGIQGTIFRFSYQQKTVYRIINYCNKFHDLLSLKHAQVALADGLRRELKKFGIQGTIFRFSYQQKTVYRIINYCNKFHDLLSLRLLLYEY